MIASDAGDGEFECGQIGKNFAVVFAHIAKFIVGKLAIIMVRVLSAVENVHHFVRPDRHHRTQHHTIDQSENC